METSPVVLADVLLHGPGEPVLLAACKQSRGLQTAVASVDGQRIVENPQHFICHSRCCRIFPSNDCSAREHKRSWPGWGDRKPEIVTSRIGDPIDGESETPAQIYVPTYCATSRINPWLFSLELIYAIKRSQSVRFLRRFGTSGMRRGQQHDPQHTQVPRPGTSTVPVVILYVNPCLGGVALCYTFAHIPARPLSGVALCCTFPHIPARLPVSV